jgi:hypothetical protein
MTTSTRQKRNVGDTYSGAGYWGPPVGTLDRWHDGSVWRVTRVVKIGPNDGVDDGADNLEGAGWWLEEVCVSPDGSGFPKPAAEPSWTPRPVAVEADADHTARLCREKAACELEAARRELEEGIAYQVIQTSCGFTVCRR